MVDVAAGYSKMPFILYSCVKASISTAIMPGSFQIFRTSWLVNLVFLNREDKKSTTACLLIHRFSWTNLVKMSSVRKPWPVPNFHQLRPLTVAQQLVTVLRDLLPCLSTIWGQIGDSASIKICSSENLSPPSGKMSKQGRNYGAILTPVDGIHFDEHQIS